MQAILESGTGESESAVVTCGCGGRAFPCLPSLAPLTLDGGTDGLSWDRKCNDLSYGHSGQILSLVSMSCNKTVRPGDVRVPLPFSVGNGRSYCVNDMIRVMLNSTVKRRSFLVALDDQVGSILSLRQRTALDRWVDQYNSGSTELVRLISGEFAM